jgi:hypothetical protein
MFILEGNNLKTMVDVTEAEKKSSNFPGLWSFVICPYFNLVTLHGSDICSDHDLCECLLHKSMLDQS